MGAELDLDDVAGRSPLAMRELAELRAERDALQARIDGSPRGIVNSPCLNNRPTWDVRGPYSPELNGKDVALVVLEDGE